MVELSEHISLLLLSNDCVIVPGWGAFIASCRPAHYDAASKTWFPPMRELGFNPSIRHNDGMLATSVSRGMATSYDVACEEVAAQVAAWKRQLAALGELHIDNLGLFVRQENGAEPVFTSDSRHIAGIRFWGLRPIEAADLESRNSGIQDINDAEASHKGLSGTILRAAASVAIIVCVLTGLLTATLHKDSLINNASLFNIAIEESAPEKFALDNDDNRELCLAKAPADGKASIISPKESETKEIVKNEPMSVTPSKSSKKYFLIVASLTNDNEVRRFVANAGLGEGEYGVLDRDGRKRVYISSGDSFEQADAARQSGNNANRFPDAWVYVRK